MTLTNESSEDDDDLIITPKAPPAITVLSPSPPAFLLQGKSRKLGRRQRLRQWLSETADTWGTLGSSFQAPTPTGQN